MSLQPGYRLFSDKEINDAIAAGQPGPTGPTGPTGATGPTGPAVTGAVLYGSTGAIPTSDPHVVGHIWSNSGTITISAG